MKIKRYDPGQLGGMKERSDGEWVRWEDVSSYVPQGISAGWKLVPIEPTAAMKKAVKEADSERRRGRFQPILPAHSAEWAADLVYREMLRAAPEAAEAHGDDDPYTCGRSEAVAKDT